MLKIPNENEYLHLRLKVAALVGYIEGLRGLLSDDIERELYSRVNSVAELMGMKSIITQAAKLQGEIL